MPKSASTIQNQISNCECKITECLAKCAFLVGDKDFEFGFSLKSFVDNITSFDIDATSDNIRKVEERFRECATIIQWEKKRRDFKAELERVLQERERRETVKRITSRNRFKTKALLLKIPSRPNRQEAIENHLQIS